MIPEKEKILYKEYHNNAMSLAEQGDIFLKNNNLIKAKECYKKAFEFEKKTAMFLIEDKKEYARTRAIVFRSAATLALEADLYNECENMILKAFHSSFIPEYLIYELKEIWDSVLHKMRLVEEGKILLYDELLVAISGDSVTEGGAYFEIIKKKLSTVISFVNKSLNELMNKDFKNKECLISNPVTSFSKGSLITKISFYGIPNNHTISLFEDGKLSKTLEKIGRRIELLNENNFEQLKTEFKSDDYFNYFLNIIKNLAPDGKSIKNFTLKAHNTNFIPLKNKTKDIEIFKKNNKQESSVETFTIKGKLISGHSMNNKIIIFNEKTHEEIKNIHVNDDIVDIVKNNFDCNVEVVLEKRNNKTYLTDLTEINS